MEAFCGGSFSVYHISGEIRLTDIPRLLYDVYHKGGNGLC